MKVLHQLLVLSVFLGLLLAACAPATPSKESPTTETREESTNLPTSTIVDTTPEDTAKPEPSPTSKYSDWSLPEQPDCHKVGDSTLYLNRTRKEYRGCLFKTTEFRPYKLIFTDQAGLTSSITFSDGSFKDSGISLGITTAINDDGIWFTNDTPQDYTVDLQPIP